MNDDDAAGGDDDGGDGSVRLNHLQCPERLAILKETVTQMSM